MSVSTTDVVSRSARVAHRLFEDRMLVITAGDSMLHRFNEVGTYIWQLLEKPRTVGTLCKEIAAHFAGFTEETHAAEVLHFLELLEKKKCIEIARKQEA